MARYFQRSRTSRDTRRVTQHYRPRRVHLRIEQLEPIIAPACPLPYPTVVSVTSATDTGSGTLRDAVNYVNTLAPSGCYGIGFQIPGTGIHTIRLTSALPTINRFVGIDGSTQPGFFGTPVIDIDGSAAGPSSNGFVFNLGSSAIAALAIHGFGASAIVFQNLGQNAIIGTYIGTDIRGTTARPNHVGVTIKDGSNSNCIGTTFNALTGLCSPPFYVPNVISGNLDAGISIQRNVTHNLIDNNHIGTDTLGTTAIPNNEGAVLSSGATGNTIGGVAPYLGNEISGNRDAGILISDRQTVNNRVQNNFIGTDPLGAFAIPNQRGVAIQQAEGNMIGGTTLAATNIISGNAVGVFLGPGANANTVANNCIGLDVNGSRAVPNTQTGITIQNGSHNKIGGLGGLGNTISGNGQDGVLITGSSSTNLLLGNFIGTNFFGTAAVPNPIGVYIQSGSFNRIGGPLNGETNLISGNSVAGVAVFSNQSINNQILDNGIGLDDTLMHALPNGIGVMVSQNAVGTTIGGTADGAVNLISGNATDGILVSNGARNTVIQGNGIGVSNGGASALPNGTNGIDLVQAINTTIGGTAPFAGNLISGNTYNGILMINGTTGTLVQGNGIGTTGDFSAGIPNGTTGVAIVQSSNNTVGGLNPAAENFIGFNGNDGVLIDAGTANTIQGNSITGDAHLGIELLDNANRNQPFPVITNAGFDTNTNLTTITGTISVAPNTTYSVDIFANYVCNPSGYGEGLAYQGTVSVTTDGSGNGSFTFVINSLLQGGIYMSATATDPAGNTSQFAACVLVTDQTGGDAPQGNPSDVTGLGTVATAASARAPAVVVVSAPPDLMPVSPAMSHAWVESQAMNRDAASVASDDFFTVLQHESAGEKFVFSPIDPLKSDM